MMRSVWSKTTLAGREIARLDEVEREAVAPLVIKAGEIPEGFVAKVS